MISPKTLCFAICSLVCASAVRGASESVQAPAREKSFMNWTKLPPIPDKEGFAGSYGGAAGGALIVAGGANFPDSRPWEGGTKTWYDKVFVLESGANEWREEGRLPKAAGYGLSLPWKDGFLIIGGGDAKENFKAVWHVTRPAGKGVTFSALPDLPRALAMQAGAVMSNYVYVVGGLETPTIAEAANVLYRLNMDNSSAGWETLVPCPGGGRFLATAVASGETVYIFGGARPDGSQAKRQWLTDAWSYHDKSGWKQLATLPNPVVAAPSPAMPVGQSHLVLLGGDDGFQAGLTDPTKHKGFPRAMLGYNIITDRWENMGDMPFSLVTTTLVPWDGGFVVTGGERMPGTRSTEVWKATMSARDTLSDGKNRAPLKTNVFVSSKDGYAYYRIPAIIKSADGTLLAFCEGRKNSRSDRGDIDLLVKRSGDGGKTWSKSIVIWDDRDNTCGNPCPVLDESTGIVWLLASHNIGTDTQDAITEGTARGTRTVWVTFSKDNGVTWAPMRQITPSVKNPEWRWYATGPGISIQIKTGTHAGRLVVPICHGNPRAAGVFYSDDHGRTWVAGADLRGLVGETQVVEGFGSPGELILNMRSGYKHGCRTQARSTDGGKTWNAPPAQVAEQTDPPCQGSILRWDDASMPNGGMLLFSNPAGEKKRVKMTVRASTDNGQTWPRSIELNEGSSAYSCLVRVDENTAACLYENGPKGDLYKQISFETFYPKDLLENEPAPGKARFLK